jgi:hypothetical protein
MNIIIHNNTGSKIAEFISDNIVINTSQDALDLMAIAFEKGIRKIILHENIMHPDFFRLKSGLAGEVIQKFVNYQIKLAIVGDFNKYNSKSLKSFIYESNNGNQFFFVSDINEALERLGKTKD